jgi:hypothetical protein
MRLVFHYSVAHENVRCIRVARNRLAAECFDRNNEPAVKKVGDKFLPNELCRWFRYCSIGR